MIIWTGWGILALLLTAAGGALGTTVGTALGAPPDEANLGSALGLALAAYAIWAIGQRLNRPVEGFDPATGQPVLYRNRHRFWLVPLQYWAPPVGAAAAVVAGIAVVG